MERDASVDVARGLAIVAIVVGHVNRGLVGSALGAEWSPDLDSVLYLFHLTVFAYLSGLFLRPSLKRQGSRSLLSQRTAWFLWLYVLWHVLQVSVKIASASVVNSPADWTDLLKLWIPEGQLWFLPWLVSVTLLVVLCRPWSSLVRGGLFLLFATVLGLATWGVDPALVLTRGGALLLPFTVGALLGPDGHRRMFERAWSPVVAVTGLAVLLAVGLLTQATPPTVETPSRTVATIALGVMGSVAGTAGVLALAATWARWAPHGIVTLFGRRSLEIFLAHIVLASGARIALARLGLESPGLYLAICTAVGILGSLALWWFVQSWAPKWLFHLPAGWERRLPARLPQEVRLPRDP